jgi:hypothetical protein
MGRRQGDPAMTPKAFLSASRLLVLNTAAQRPNRMVLPLPATLKARGAARLKLLDGLLSAALIEEVPVTEDALRWRPDPDGGGLGLRLTENGLAAVHAIPAPPRESVAPEPNGAPRASAPASIGAVCQPAPEAPTISAEPERPASAHAVRPGGKLGQVLDAIAAGEGATLLELVSLTGWQPHTTRAAVTGLRQRGYPVLLSEHLGRKAYRLAAQG